MTQGQEPHIFPRNTHNISRSNISEQALKVLYRLHNAGYAAYLVGGGVRDILSDRQPKDFDIVTDAHPEQIKKLFNNCRLIGRRFRLAHVCFGRDYIEVATFRAGGEEDTRGNEVHSETGRILRDNVYGTIDDDVWRRDFTINALYYNIADFSVVDFVGGVEDIQNKIIRPIGEAVVRFREDPVRMLRAIRFAGKFNWDIESDTQKAIHSLAEMITDVPPARLFDEMLKLFLSGSARSTFELLLSYGMIKHLFPNTERLLFNDEGEPSKYLTMLRKAMDNTDERIAAGKPVTPAFLFAALHWAPVHEEVIALRAEGAPPAEATHTAAGYFLYSMKHHITIPRRFSVQVKDIWNLQHRLEYTTGRRPMRVLTHPKFRAGYDFLLLRALAGDADPELAKWWTEFQELPHEKQRTETVPAKKRRRRRRKRQSSSE